MSEPLKCGPTLRFWGDRSWILTQGCSWFDCKDGLDPKQEETERKEKNPTAGSRQTETKGTDGFEEGRRSAATQRAVRSSETRNTPNEVKYNETKAQKIKPK